MPLPARGFRASDWGNMRSPRLIIRLLGLAAAAAALTGCAAMTRPPKPRPTVTIEPGEPWRRVATVKDETTLNQLPAAWSEVLAQARAAGFTRAIAREGGLFDPAAALPRPAPSPGAYACRLFTLGAGTPRGKAFVAGRSAFCFVGVEAGQLSFTADLVPVRIGGYLWEQEGASQITFLGSSARGKAASLPPYGSAAQSDVPGVFERVGEFRYRLVLASPALGGRLAVLELRPALAAR
jgi:hypothetical protein